MLSRLGYRSRTIQIPAFTTPTLDLGTIVLAPTATELSEVQVVAPKPLIEHDLDKISYNVDADPESSTLTALEMLRKVPLLTVDADDNLQLNGKDNYQVLINGKPSALFAQSPSEVFSSMPAGMIKRIEVITNPPSRYDAQGVGGVLNIITYKKSLNGYNGSANAGASSPNGLSYGGYTSAKVGLFSLSANAGGQERTSPTSRRSMFREDFLRRSRLEQTGTSNNNSRSYYLSGEAGFESNAQNQLSLNYGLSRGNGANSSVQQAQLLNGAGELKQAYQNLNAGQNAQSGYDVGLNYQHSFKNNEARLLTLAYKTSSSTSTNGSDFTVLPLLNYKGRVSTTHNDDRTQEQTLQLDYVQPIRKQTLEMGLKTSFQRNSSDYFYQTRDSLTDVFVLDPKLSNNFSYQQAIHSAYTSLILKKNKWRLQAGARLELTRVDADFKTSGTLARHQYTNLVPNLNISRRLKEASTLSASYTQRLLRPALYLLNPYVDLTDPQNISYGNPGLHSTISHVFSASFSSFVKSTSINVSLTHDFTASAIQQLTTVGPDSVARTTSANNGRNQRTSLSLNSNTTVLRKLTLSANSSLGYARYSSQLGGRPRTNAGYTLQASANASYRLGKTWRTSGSLGYSSSGILLQGKTASTLWNTVALNKDLLKNNKARFSLSVSSPFQQYRRNASELTDPTFHQVQESRVVIRRFNAALTYRFGKI
ncbi:TonB-dependent receptor [Hymenobacter sp. BT770]|uniref:outer membrane beta-barrel protein n=1 Tax=Hymenobacter sp. BT770 TaxID=2886942 RepID=UPI001D11E6BF|nr:outer membrane beta-barrel protein [Hymenobacter sp. BT770]MCC3155175.1 TonB-dependent receptor [Hymenobacter sp. BT770]MDO3417223.1 TonB-dependent receptor [Hymenobacter sp. BT770]